MYLKLFSTQGKNSLTDNSWHNMSVDSKAARSCLTHKVIFLHYNLHKAYMHYKPWEETLISQKRKLKSKAILFAKNSLWFWITQYYLISALRASLFVPPSGLHY